MTGPNVRPVQDGDTESGDLPDLDPLRPDDGNDLGADSEIPPVSDSKGSAPDVFLDDPVTGEPALTYDDAGDGDGEVNPADPADIGGMGSPS